MNIDQLLDLAKERQEIESDNALATALGVSRQRVSSWRNGHRHPEPVTCATLAGLSGEPLAKVLGIVGEARAISREEKAVWRKLAATAALLFLMVLPWGNPAAAYTSPNVSSGQQYALCEVVRGVGRWFLRLALGWIRGRQPPALLA